MAPARPRGQTQSSVSGASGAGSSASPGSKAEGSKRGRPSTPADQAAIPVEWLAEAPSLTNASSSFAALHSSRGPSDNAALLGLAPGSIGAQPPGSSPGMVSPALGSGGGASDSEMEDGGAASSPSSNVTAADIVARCNHLTVALNDKMYTWGGWLGVGAEHPPADVICCFDLTAKDVNPAMSFGNAAASLSSVGANLAASGGGGATSSSTVAAAAASVSAGAWQPTLLRTSSATEPHPATTQFAWAEVAPGTVILFGGWTGTTRCNAVTMLSISEMRWRTLECTGDKPPPLTFATAVCAGKRFAVYGGNGADGPTSDVYVLDLSTMQWRLMPSAGCPPKRSSHTACVVRDSLMVVFGGRSAPDLNTLSLSGGLSPGGGGGGGSHQSPAQQQAHMMQLQLQQYTSAPLLMNDVGVFDLAASHWQIGMRIEGTAPPARYGQSAVATSTHLVVFGGIGDQGQMLNDVWVLGFDKPGAILWRPVTVRDTPNPAGLPPPMPRCGAGFVRLTRSCMAVVGGRMAASSLVPLKPTHAKFPCTASVHFLDMTKISEEAAAAAAAAAHESPITTPSP